VYLLFLPRNLLFVYPYLQKYPFGLPSYSARRATAQWDMAATTMATVDDDNDANGDGATDSEADSATGDDNDEDDDGDDNNDGNGEVDGDDGDDGDDGNGRRR